jgi:hypothetical protein
MAISAIRQNLSNGNYGRSIFSTKRLAKQFFAIFGGAP